MILLTQVLWPLVTLGIAAMGCFAFCRWLMREQSSVRTLRAELTATQGEWTQRFESVERQHELRVTTLEKRVNAMTPAMNPLGSHYSTRGGA